eukprot:3720828-Pyramimonas_sp.AAC.1
MSSTNPEVPNSCTDGGRNAQSLDSGYIGLATSTDGVNWRRGKGAVSLRGDRTAFAAGTDVGTVLTPDTENWWVFDTCHVGIGDVQMLNSDHVQVREITCGEG